MRHPHDRLLDSAVLTLVAVVLTVAYARTLAPGVTWANNGVDSGDLITAAAVLGVAHPTGYPTYLLLARLFQMLPVGDLAFRTTILSASAAVLAALCTYIFVRQVCSKQGWCSAIAAGSAALSFGLSRLMWSQAVVAEVYSLNGLFAAIILLFIVSAAHRDTWPTTFADRYQGLVVGVGLGNHLTLAILALAWLVAATIADPPSLALRSLTRRLTWIGIGTLVYLYLPIRAAAYPPVNWGNPRDWFGFWWVVSGQPYHNLAFGLPPALLYYRVEAWASLLVEQFGWLGLALGFFGLFYGHARARLFLGLTGAVAIAYSVFAIMYNSADSDAYLIPVFLIFAAWIGLGIHQLLGGIQQHQHRMTPAAAVIIPLLLVSPALSNVSRVDASQDNRAIDFATNVLADASPRAIVVTSSDVDTFPIWYYHHALGMRRDITVVVEPLLTYAWYRETLQAVDPALKLPDQKDLESIETLIALNRGSRAICRTETEGVRFVTCSSVGRTGDLVSR